MSKNKSKTETKASNDDKPNKGQVWDKRFGDWASLDHNTDSQLPSYSRLLSKEETVFIIREFRLCNVDNDGNRYLIKDHFANNLFYGVERSAYSNRLCFFGANRAFDLTFFDKNRAPALNFYRPFRIGCCGIIPCCRQKIIIKDNLDKNMGEVTQKLSFCQFSLKLKSNQTELQIYGPCCELRFSYCMNDLCFNVYDKSDAKDGYKKRFYCQK